MALFAEESGIQPDGQLTAEAQASYEFCWPDVFFQENKIGQWRARNILIDTEPEIVNKIKKSELSDLYDTDSFVTGKISSCFFGGELSKTDNRELIENTLMSCR